MYITDKARKDAENVILGKYHDEVTALATQFQRDENVREAAKQLVELAEGREPIKCIKILRLCFGLGLKEAKDMIDAYRADYASKDDLPF